LIGETVATEGAAICNDIWTNNLSPINVKPTTETSPELLSTSNHTPVIDKQAVMTTSKIHSLWKQILYKTV